MIVDVKRAAASIGLLLLSGGALACGSDLPLDEGSYQFHTDDPVVAECDGAEPAFGADFQGSISGEGDSFELGLPGGTTACTVSDSAFHCDPLLVRGESEFHPILETVCWFETTTRIAGTAANRVRFTAAFDNSFRCGGDAEGCDLLVQQTTSAVPCEWSQQYEAYLLE